MKRKRKRAVKQTQTIKIDGNKIKVLIRVLEGNANIVYTNKQKRISVISAGGDLVFSK